MFALNLSYNLGVADDVDGLKSAIALAAGNYEYRLDSLPEFPKLLIDPQLYLSGLDVKLCKNVCEKLATYSWFQIPGIPKLQPNQKKAEYQELVSAAIETNWKSTVPSNVYDSCSTSIQYQVLKKCSQIILPSPLITAREDEAAAQAAWLDEGLKAATDLDTVQPLIATVAIDEQILNSTCFLPGGYLDTLVDQYTARPGIAGVYIVISQTHKRQPYASSDLVNHAYMSLVKKFASSGLENIIVNFADLFGIACIGAGATLVATGNSQSSRTLSFKNFEPSTGGMALPHFFSRYSLSEYLSEAELSIVAQKKLLRRIEDVTVYSKPLIDALKSGSTAASVPAWAESRSNVTASKKHFLKCLCELLNSIRLQTDRKAYIRNMLEDAEMVQSFLKQKINNSFPAKRAPVEKWIECIDKN